MSWELVILFLTYIVKALKSLTGKTEYCEKNTHTLFMENPKWLVLGIPVARACGSLKLNLGDSDAGFCHANSNSARYAN